MTLPPDDRPPRSDAPDDDGARWWELEIDANQPEEGSFMLGFVAGVVGGLIVVLLVLRRAKPNTRMGVWFGLVAQVFLALWLARYLQSLGALPMIPKSN